MEEYRLNDELLNKLLKKPSQQAISERFTAKVMDDISALEAEKKHNPYLSVFTLIYIAAGIVLLVLLYLVIFPFFDISLFNPLDADTRSYERLFSLVMDSFRSLVSIIDFIRNSTLAVVLIIVLPSLAILDRLLKNLWHRSTLVVI